MRTLIVGRGRMGLSLARAMPDATLQGRGATGTGADLVLLAVPDAEIAAAAALIAPGPLVAHLSGATGLGPLGDREAFSLHPLLSVTGAATSFAGAFAAIDGTSPRAVSVAEALAATLGLRAFHVAAADRAGYHAAATVAANFLVTLEDFAERLAAQSGVPREALVPLATAALAGWASDGAAALTGPIARGDEATAAAQRVAVAARVSPDDLAFFDALTCATRALVGRAGLPGPIQRGSEPPQKETTA